MASNARYEKLRDRVTEAEQQRTHAIAARDRCLAASEEASAEVTAAEEAAKIVAEAAEQHTSASVAAFESTANGCVRAIFGESLRVRLLLKSATGKAEIEIQIEQDGELLDPLSACGGGVVDVVCFGLRLAAVLHDARKVRRLLVLDEPFRFVSVEYRARLAMMLEAIAKERGVQVILVTHHSEFELGETIRLSDA